VRDEGRQLCEQMQAELAALRGLVHEQTAEIRALRDQLILRMGYR
jgi:hypothetical protein